MIGRITAVVLQHNDYLLWRLRDKPGQSTLGAFEAQPLTRTAAFLEETLDTQNPNLHRPAAMPVSASKKLNQSKVLHSEIPISPILRNPSDTDQPYNTNRPEDKFPNASIEDLQWPGHTPEERALDTVAQNPGRDVVDKQESAQTPAAEVRNLIRTVRTSEEFTPLDAKFLKEHSDRLVQENATNLSGDYLNPLQNQDSDSRPMIESVMDTPMAVPCNTEECIPDTKSPASPTDQYTRIHRKFPDIHEQGKENPSRQQLPEADKERRASSERPSQQQIVNNSNLSSSPDVPREEIMPVGFNPGCEKRSMPMDLDLKAMRSKGPERNNLGDFENGNQAGDGWQSSLEGTAPNESLNVRAAKVHPHDESSKAAQPLEGT